MSNSTAETTSWMNPVLRGFNPDPTICVVKGSGNAPTTYFLSTSTFEYFPGCPIYSSTDLLNWKLIGHALNRRSQLDMRTVEPGAGTWASTLRYRSMEKRFYLTTGVYHRYRPSSDERIFPRGFYVYTDDIWDDAAWSEPIFFDNPGFDQDLFWDDATSKVYLSTTHRLAIRPPNSKQKDFAIHISEIDLETGRTLTAPEVIRTSPHGIAEGSHIIKRGDFHYLFTAEGGTEAGHQEWVFRSRQGPLGPWEGTDKPLWYNGSDEEVQRTGHADVFEDQEGNWWAVLLGVRPLLHDGEWLEPQLGRETFLVAVDWVEDWPVFNGGRNITLKTAGRTLQTTEVTSPKSWAANLQNDALELGWYQKQTPLKRCYSLTERPGYLRIYGGCYNLSSPENPTVLLRKQTSYNEVFKAELTFNPTRRGYEAGVVLWWSNYSYATIGITAKHNASSEVGPAIISREPRESNTTKIIHVSYPEVSGIINDSTTVTLTVRCQDTKYRLSLETNDASHHFEVSASELTFYPPIGGAFAGAMYGVYSFGDGEPVLDPADFGNIRVIYDDA